jgi:hypothetical protein
MYAKVKAAYERSDVCVVHEFNTSAFTTPRRFVSSGAHKPPAQPVVNWTSDS